MGVLLLTSASLSVVNLVSSIIYVTLVPYASIAFTMLYFDEKAAKEANAVPATGRVEHVAARR